MGNLFIRYPHSSIWHRRPNQVTRRNQRPRTLCGSFMSSALALSLRLRGRRKLAASLTGRSGSPPGHSGLRRGWRHARPGHRPWPTPRRTWRPDPRNARRWYPAREVARWSTRVAANGLQDLVARRHGSFVRGVNDKLPRFVDGGNESGGANHRHRVNLPGDDESRAKSMSAAERLRWPEYASSPPYSRMLAFIRDYVLGGNSANLSHFARTTGTRGGDRCSSP